jgi:tRNA pseudouridine32 synthase/23S rRNA pseudouridine746 synthase
MHPPSLAPPALAYKPPQDPWLDILYQDEHLLVVNKPAGLLSTPGRGADLFDSVEARAKKISPYAELAHRLDMATSGVVAVALQKQAESNLKRQFQLRIPQKRYLARVWGCPEPEQGIIDLPLICDWPKRPMQKVCWETGKQAVTHYQVLDKQAASSLVELRPITGRSHQLRVHLLALGCPILGDRFYAHAEALAASERLLLHAAELVLEHPQTGAVLTFTAPCPFT